MVPVVYMSLMSVPTGVPPPPGYVHRVVGSPAAPQPAPNRTAAVCDDTKCLTYYAPTHTTLWFVCVDPNTCGAEHMVGVQDAFNFLKTSKELIAGGGSGAAAGAAFGIVLGPEMAPIGALIGGAFGGALAAGNNFYELYGKYSCLSSDDADFPQTAKEILWCAK